MGAEYLFYMKSIETHARAFLALIILGIGTVYTQCSYHIQRYTYRVLQTIQMKLTLLCVWAELAVLGSTKTALKFKYEI